MVKHNRPVPRCTGTTNITGYGTANQNYQIIIVRATACKRKMEYPWKTSEGHGYTCQFLSQPSEELICKRCNYVARDLTMTICCCQHYCQDCISPLQAVSKPCPGCGEEQFTTVPHKRHGKTILVLQVICTMQERGCNWTGKLEELATHVDVEENNCQYIDVQCPYNCSNPVPRCDVATHLDQSCPKRDYSCEHCGTGGTYEVITNEHIQQCALKEIPCPNDCPEGSIKQGVLQEHLMTCEYQQIECKVQGCGGKFMRADSENHNSNNTSKHIGLLSETTTQLGHDTTFKLQHQELQSNARERKMAADLASENKALKAELLQSKAEIRDLRHEMATLSERLQKLTNAFTQHSRQQAGNPPHHFTIYDFEYRKQNELAWYSSPMYVAKGPKIAICVRPNGTIGTHAQGSHVSVLLCALIGDNDDSINWPIRCTITVELRNQRNNRNHHRIQRGFQWERPRGRKTVEHFGNDLNKHQFISHAGLEGNAQRQIRYLQDDTLHLVVVRIEPHSEIHVYGHKAERMLFTSLSPEKSQSVTSM